MRRGDHTRSDNSVAIEPVSGLAASSRIAALRTTKQLVVKAVERLTRRARIRFAAGFAVEAVEHYWMELQRGDAKPWAVHPPLGSVDLVALDESSQWLARTLGRAAAHVDPVTAGYFVGTTYAAALPSELRALLGVYYTPPALAARLLDQAVAAGVDWSRCSVLDPACGGGAFLAPVAERILKELSHLDADALLDTVATRIHGFEIDPIAAWMSQVFLEAVMLPTSRTAGRRFPVVVEVRNSLAGELADGSFDLVVGNPPYGRISLSPRMRARYADGLYGHANLYGLFTQIALRLAKPGGVVGYVTPTSFLAGEYYKNLRTLLSRESTPLSIDFIAERKGVFDEVLQETLLATYRRLTAAQGARPESSAPVTLITPVDEGVVRVTSVGSFRVPSTPGSPWLIPRDAAQAALVNRLLKMPDRLVDWGYEVSTGPLVWNRHKEQLRQHWGPGCLPLVWAEAIRSDGSFLLQATKPNHRLFFKPRTKDGWLVVTRSCVLVQRTTAKEQARRLVAAVLPESVIRKHGGTTVENHLNMLRPVRPSPPVPPATLAAFLNSPVADRVFRCFSGSVAVSAYELEALPLPPAAALSELDAAVRERASRDALDSICAGLYGLDATA